MKIGRHAIGPGNPVFFIADIAANHDGDLSRAVDLIHLSAEAGASAAKFQHFQARTIVSDEGFQSLGGQQSHQAKWRKSVYQVYQAAEVDVKWTETLKKECDRAGIVFFTSPYSLALVDAVDSYVPAYKIGSGDITWLEIIRHIAGKQKPYMLASGASNILEVQDAVETGYAINPDLLLMQCNTNYTASTENFRHINLNVLKTFSAMFPELLLGLSDHTPGHATVLGAVALGACAIEKHFTDDNEREGPDHPFSMNPASWREMVERSRELELALGDGRKRIEDNERETVVLQRRALRLTRSLEAGETIGEKDLVALRPCPVDAIPLSEKARAVGCPVRRSMQSGDYLKWLDLDSQS